MYFLNIRYKLVTYLVPTGVGSNKFQCWRKTWMGWAPQRLYACLHHGTFQRFLKNDLDHVGFFLRPSQADALCQDG